MSFRETDQPKKWLKRAPPLKVKLNRRPYLKNVWPSAAAARQCVEDDRWDGLSTALDASKWLILEFHMDHTMPHWHFKGM